MYPFKVPTGGRVVWTVVAYGVAALMIAGCGGGGGDGSSAGGGHGSGGVSGATGGTSTATGGSGGGTGGVSAGTGGSTDASGGASAGAGGSPAAGSAGASSATGGGGAPTGGAAAGIGGSTIGGTGGHGGGAGSAGAGGMAAGGRGGTTGQGGRGMLTLSSTALINSGTFMPVNTCAGANQSPPFAWTTGPAGTQSYAMVLLDTANMRYHWAIWNIPASVQALPAALPAGAAITTPVAAMQAITGSGTPGYQGPCPSGATHTYVFTLYALDVAMLPGVSGTSMAQAVSAALQSHVLASGTLTGSSNATRP